RKRLPLLYSSVYIGYGLHRRRVSNDSIGRDVMGKVKGTGLKALMAAGALSALLIAPVSTAQADDSQIVVFAAASLKNALDAINTACEADVGEAAKISYASSSALAKQIEEGAPADLFISADLDWMKYLS